MTMTINDHEDKINTLLAEAWEALTLAQYALHDQQAHGMADDLDKPVTAIDSMIVWSTANRGWINEPVR